MAYIPGNDGDNNLEGTVFDDDIYGFGGDDLLEGFGGEDILDGGTGDDRLFGDSGDDDLIGGSGVNDLTGGSGIDWFVMSGRDDIGFSDDLITDFQFDVDRVDVSAWGVSSFDQILAILKADRLGDATFNAFYKGFDHIVTFDDTRPAQLVARDFVYSDSFGRDLIGTNSDDTLFGSTSRDVLEGRGGDDVLLGGFGDDDLYGDYGRDMLLGGDGEDDLYGGSGQDELAGGGDRDILEGGGGADFIEGNGDHDNIFGNTGGDRLFAGSGVDRLDGGGGNDRISGGSGDDDLIGGKGRDTLAGGGGEDAFIFNSASESRSGSSRRDLIRDFNPGPDFIDVEAIDADRTTPTDQDFDFIGQGDFTGAGQLRYFVSGDLTIVQGNTDNDAGNEFEVALDGRFTLVASDFIL